MTPYGAIGAVDVLADAIVRCIREPTLPGESDDGPVYLFCDVQGIAPSGGARPSFRTKVNIAPRYGPETSIANSLQAVDAGEMTRTKFLKKPPWHPPRRFRFSSYDVRRSIRALVYVAHRTHNLCRFPWRVVCQGANLGLDWRPCERCGHRRDMHRDLDGVRLCIVCENVGRWPCSR